MQNGSHRRWREILDVIATIGVIVLSGTVVWALVLRAPAPAPRVAPARAARPAPRPLPVEPISIAGATLIGSDTAKVALIAYSEFKCPFCGLFARDTLPKLTQKYVDTKKVLFVFRHFPLDNLHPFARKIAQAADCANSQGKFLQLHDELFKDQPGLNEETLAAKVKALGLNTQAFEGCMTEQAARRIEDDVTTGKALGVTGTPTFFIGLTQGANRVKLVQQFSGAQAFEQFQTNLDKWIQEAEKGTK